MKFKETAPCDLGRAVKWGYNT